MKVSDVFSRSLFWDVNPENLDWKKDSLFIIQRVLVRGGMNDVKKVMLHYNRQEIIENLLMCRELDKVTHNFCANYFNIPKERMHAPSQHY